MGGQNEGASAPFQRFFQMLDAFDTDEPPEVFSFELGVKHDLHLLQDKMDHTFLFPFIITGTAQFRGEETKFLIHDAPAFSGHPVIKRSQPAGEIKSPFLRGDKDQPSKGKPENKATEIFKHDQKNA